MKKLLLGSALALATVVAYGQGQVNFQNVSSLWGNSNYLLKWGDSAALYNSALTSGGLVSSNYAGVNLSGLRAELLYGASTITDITKLSEASPSGTAGYATFKQSTSANTGSWFGGVRTLTGAGGTFQVGDTVSLGIIVWDINKAADGLTAYAGKGVSYDGLLGYSSVFQFTCPTGNPAPAALLPAFTPFTVGYTPVPEPTTLALVGLGAAGMLIFRRRK